MCLIAFAWRTHPAYDLILAANRDEFHQRPTDPAHVWTDAPGVFAGRDRQAGGAWCGLGPGGRFAAVTNVREPDPPADDKRSRGALVADYLSGTEDARRYGERIHAERHAYSGFNLLIGDRDDLFYLSNRDDRGMLGVPPGLHALSNGVWGDVWPKTQRAQQGLRSAIADADVDPGDLLDLFADETPAEQPLPDTGLGETMERFLSPIFVRGSTYGTRASSVILRGVDGSLRMLEQSFGANGERAGRIDQFWQPT